MLGPQRSGDDWMMVQHPGLKETDRRAMLKLWTPRKPYSNHPLNRHATTKLSFIYRAWGGPFMITCSSPAVLFYYCIRNSYSFSSLANCPSSDTLLIAASRIKQADGRGADVKRKLPKCTASGGRSVPRTPMSCSVPKIASPDPSLIHIRTGPH